MTRRTVPFVALLLALLFTIAFFRGPSARRGAVWALGRAAPYGLVLAAAAGLAALWYFHRPQPAPAKMDLFRGVSFEKEVRTSPRPIVIHVVRVDLRDPAISFVVTPHKTSGLTGKTTSQFLLEEGAQLAVNGDFFLPWWSNGPHDYYPHAGDPTDVLGASVSNGVENGWHTTPYTALVFNKDRTVVIREVTDPLERFPGALQVMSGKQLLLENGRKTRAVSAETQARVTHPRLAAALDRSGGTLLLVAIDGRQPGYSEGVTLSELAEIVLSHGGHRAMNLDGGGSTTVVIADGDGGTRPLNIPFHTRIPWRERPVANHLGVFAAPSSARHGSVK